MPPVTEGRVVGSAEAPAKPRSEPTKRYPSDLTDAQWSLIELLLPPPATGHRWPCGEASPPRDRERDLVPGSGGVRVAAAAQVFPAVGDGVLALCPLEERRHRGALVFADGGYAGRLVRWAEDRLRLVIEIVRKPADQRGFAVLPRRWVVERTPAWLTRCRRLIRDYEQHPESHEAMVKWAMIGLMTRRLATTTAVASCASGTRPGTCQWSEVSRR